MADEKSKIENHKSEIALPLPIGRREYVAFPDWKIRHVRAKVDTGAFTSALDVLSYEMWQADGQGLRVRLRLALNRKRPDRYRIVEAPVLRVISVCSTAGIRELRPLIETTIRLGPVTRRIRLTVTNRAAMRCRMILGREALRGAFVVDVSRKYLLRGQESGVRDQGPGVRGQEAPDLTPDS
jgi:hypothetical protein